MTTDQLKLISYSTLTILPSQFTKAVSRLLF